MPFILDSASSLCTESPSTHHPSKQMSPLNIFRRKSSHSSNSNRTLSISSKKPKSSAAMDFPKSPFTTFSAATRRPANPPTIHNPFAKPANNSSPPPPYSGPAPESASPVSIPIPSVPAYTAPSAEVAPSTDSKYAFLSKFDTIFVIDDSGSMAGRSWRETSAALSAITPICTAFDKDGIDIYFLNNMDDIDYKNITRPEQVQQIFDTVRPGGGTPTGTKLSQILKPYLAELHRKSQDIESVKPLNIIVITDGVPSDDPESVIINAAKKLDKLDAPSWQIGVQFFQVGAEPGAAEALQELDDQIKDHVPGGCRDIVDTVPWKGANGASLNADGILKVVLGSVNKRLDRKRVSLDGRGGEMV